MWLGWTPRLFEFTLLFAFVPLLVMDEDMRQKKKSVWKVFINFYLAFFWWNLFCTWWVANTYSGTHDVSSIVAGALANILNPLLMCIPIFFYLRTRKKFGWKAGLISLPFFWMCFEWLHLNWELAWPWLNLGNGLAEYPQFIQWYEFTGTFGGTLWIWMVNILIYIFFFTNLVQTNKIQRWIYVASSILIPVVISEILFAINNPALISVKKKSIVIVQPNIDPYNTKFDFSTLDEQLKTLFTLSSQQSDSSTDYIAWPETAIPQGVLLNNLENDPSIKKIKKFLHAYPKSKLVTGFSSYKYYDSQQTITAREDGQGGFYDAFNSAIQLDTSVNEQIYHKSKLVVGVECVPYPGLFKYLEPLLVQFGGISVSLGKQEHRSVFYSDDSTGVAPVICYESIFGDYCTEYIRRGANFIFILTNDGWWGNTAGHIQHERYAALRAIETRRFVIRSANTGTSCVINSRGEISNETEYWKPAAIRTELPVLKGETFYVKYGDYIAQFALGFSALLLISTFFYNKKNGVTELNSERN